MQNEGQVGSEEDKLETPSIPLCVSAVEGNSAGNQACLWPEPPGAVQCFPSCGTFVLPRMSF